MPPKITHTLLAASTILFSSGSLVAQAADVYGSSAGKIKVETIADGIENPWGMAMMPDGNLLVTERGAKLWKIDRKSGAKTEVTGLPSVAVGGQGGLLDIAIAPDFASSGALYLSYSTRIGSGFGTAIASAKFVDGDQPTLSETKQIFAQNKGTSTGRHFGSRIRVRADGTLFFTIGDRGAPDRAQDPMDHAGSVLRINPDGSAPADNFSSTGAKAAPEIWSIGHRNPQGAALHPETGELWTVEHGAAGGDEINQPEVGKNYGWPKISYGRNYSGSKIGVGTEAPGLEQPKYYWDPSIAPSGMTFYTSDLFPAWKGDIFVGALRGQKLVRLDVQDGKITGEEALLEDEYGRVRDVRSFPDGALWLLTDEGDGKVLRITPAG